MPEAKAEQTFDTLNPKVKAFLGRLDEDDVGLLEKSIDLSRHVASAGRVAKWLVVALFGLIVGLSAVGDAAVKILHWFQTGR
ncbi:hypothetical protein [Xanthobacter versatilis]|uniref:hypothetical protein n=1 Tax=Xanthobacter autotrophicus (strain ATCC BAA-1158 / Py2) TaxID=78245 RepID=UPI00372CDF61